MARTIYLGLNFTEGRVYADCKTPKEGFEDFTKKDGTVVYRHYYNRGVYAYLKSVSIRDQKMKDNLVVKMISIQMKSLGGDTMYLNVSIFDQKGDIQSYAVSFIRVLR